MKKLLVLISIITSGCASSSQYQIGCRDGVRTWVQEVQHAGVEESVLEIGCKNIERHYK
jgi:hypothetical protein